MHQIQKLNSFSSRLAIVFAQFSEARCYVENEDVIGAAPTGNAATTSEWSIILLPIKVWLILEVWRYMPNETEGITHPCPIFNDSFNQHWIEGMYK